MKALKWIGAVLFSAASLSALATDIPASNIIDNYKGAGYHSDVKGDASIYDTTKMVVSRTGTLMTVDVFSNFAGNNGHDGIQFGDLFMSTNVPINGIPWKPNSDNDRYSKTGNNTPTNWNYAYNLWNDTRGNQTSGWGRLVSGFDNNDLRVSNSSGNRHNQAVALSSNRGHVAESGWNKWNANSNKISFSFDVSGTALENATQIAFRWAMTCANDIIEGVVAINGSTTTPIPAPQTLLLMMLGLTGLVMRKKAK